MLSKTWRFFFFGLRSKARLGEHREIRPKGPGRVTGQPDCSVQQVTMPQNQKQNHSSATFAQEGLGGALHVGPVVEYTVQQAKELDIGCEVEKARLEELEPSSNR